MENWDLLPTYSIVSVVGFRLLSIIFAGQRPHLPNSAGMNTTHSTFGEGGLGMKCQSWKSGGQKPPSYITKCTLCIRKIKWWPLLPMTYYCGAAIKGWHTDTMKRSSLQSSGASVKVKVKVLLLYSAAQLKQMVSVALYNLTPGRGLTQPCCEPSPWGDQSRQAAYIPCRASAKCLSSLCCQSQFYTLVRWGTHGVHILPKDVTAQLGLVMYHTMEQCQQDGHPSMY